MTLDPERNIVFSPVGRYQERRPNHSITQTDEELLSSMQAGKVADYGNKHDKKNKHTLHEQ